jgi:hypothetical protein
LIRDSCPLRHAAVFGLSSVAQCPAAASGSRSCLVYTVRVGIRAHIWVRESNVRKSAISSMYPSYPGYTRHTNLSIQFAVPNQHIVRIILQHCEDEDNLRFRAAGNTLYPRVRELARLMSRHRIQLTTMKTSELGVTLFLPPPPCPAPKSILAKLCTRFRRPKAYSPQLETIEEGSEEDLPEGEWITLYEYMPIDSKRRAMYVVSDEYCGSIRLHV